MISKDKLFLGMMILLNLILIYLRVNVVSAEGFGGNFLSTVIFFCILLGLLYLFLSKKYDYFIILWLSFYFASPIITLPFTSIGSLGILNAIFIPLMLYKIFNFKNKYLIIILILFLVSALHLADVDFRTIISKIILFLAPLVFFYFVLKKCKDLKLVMWSSVIIALINVPLGIYEILFRPVWGITVDWRGVRIFGNLFWHNAYSLFLLPSILTLYAFFRKTSKKSYFILMLVLIVMDVFTFSRDGLFSLIIGFIVFEALYRTGFKVTYKKFVIVCLLILCVISYAFVFPNLDTHLTPATITERTSIWESITPFIEGNLVFGNGLGSYEVYRVYFLNELSSHNYYLNIIFELGLVGLSLFLLFMWFIFKDLKKNLNSKNHFRAGELGVALLAVIFCFSLAGNGAFTQVVSLNLWIVLACCVKYDEKD